MGDSEKKLFLGIDPGMEGAWSVVDEDGSPMQRTPTPRVAGSKGGVDVKAIVDWLLSLDLPSYKTVVAVFEDVHPLYMVTASSTGKLMESKGQIEGILFSFAALSGANIRIEPLTPKKWQSKVWTPFDKVMKNGKQDPKGTSIAAAKRIWPAEDFRANPRCRVPHDGIVDATLMAEAGRRLFK